MGMPETLAEALRLARAGKLEAAATLCEEILARYPDDPGALHLAGALALQRGDPARAVVRLQAALRVRPDNAAALSDLGLALHAQKRLGEAAEVLTQALGLQPDAPELMLNLGNVRLDQSRDATALELFRRALALRPEFPEALNSLGLVELRLGFAVEALESARRALAIRPGFVEAHQTAGRALVVLGRYEEAMAAHREVLRLRPDAAEGHLALARACRSFGRLEEAASHCRTALALAPARGEAYRMLVELTRQRPGSDELVRMEVLWQRPDLPPRDRMQLGFALGKASEDIGEPARAMQMYQRANALKRARFEYSTADSAAVFEDVRASFTAALFDRFAGSGNEDETPIFIIGMPRSGTTLVEQILASHPEVFGAGEHALLNTAVGGLHVGDGPFRFGSVLGAVSRETLARLADAYLGAVRRFSSGSRFITDKMPGNFLLVGMIRLMLPRARVIHCRRDPVETCLSIYKTHFGGEGLRYAYDLTEIGHYYRLYHDLMDHWRQVLPGFVLDVHYEDLVTNQERVTRELLAACGLAWDPGCLDFHSTARPVQTASAAQVREPIHGRSLHRAAPFGDVLRPLRDALAGLT